MHKIRIISAVLAGVCAIIAGTLWFRTFSSESGVGFVNETSMSFAKESETNDESQTESEEVRVCVFVCGAVNNPGVVYLEAGARVKDALEKAGGFSNEACMDYLNLARVISDGEQIYVPKEGESKAADSLGVEDSQTALININTADEKLLTSLPGIGESRAKDIVDYRNENGKFSQIEDLMKVTGIKEASFNKIKEYICV